MGQCVIIIDLFSMEFYTCELEYMRNIIKKKKIFTFQTWKKESNIIQWLADLLSHGDICYDVQVIYIYPGMLNAICCTFNTMEFLHIIWIIFKVGQDY
jgi:hypothetical protein